jgi:hypothetical protein
MMKWKLKQIEGDERDGKVRLKQYSLPLEDKGIESIPLKSGEGLWLRSGHSSGSLCQKNPKSADFSTYAREK